MKKMLLILVTAIGFGMIANAQDIILKRDGTEIKAKVLETTDQVIKYKEFDFQDGPTRNINKSEVFRITYSNGKIELFNKNVSSSKRQSTSNCVNNTAFGLDIGLGGSLGETFASSLGIRVMHHFNPYFGIDFLKINWITDVITDVGTPWKMRLQLMSGFRGNSPVFFKCMSVYSAFRLGYGMDFRLWAGANPKEYITPAGKKDEKLLDAKRNFQGLCLETELGVNLTPTVFAGFSYNYHKYYPNGESLKLATHTFSLRLGFNFGKTQEAKAKAEREKTERKKAEIENAKVYEKAEIVKTKVDKKMVMAEKGLDNMTSKVLDLLKYDGYDIIDNKIVNLKQRESDSHAKYFHEGVKYVVICITDDPDVLDIGLHLERLSGTIDNTYPTDRGEMAILSFKPRIGRELKVIATNLSSRTQNSTSKFRIIIAYKKY